MVTEFYGDGNDMVYPIRREEDVRGTEYGAWTEIWSYEYEDGRIVEANMPGGGTENHIVFPSKFTYKYSGDMVTVTVSHPGTSEANQVSSHKIKKFGNIE